ncbi:putative N-acetyltransferase 8B [Loxodonta africana]|uniref:putative N-acetyltransferase 8B n=1 Tax=Loxodonta africana TaxID=9785 RepID=UPI0030CFFEF8
MATYHIRKYRESDHKEVIELFSVGMTENIPATFRHLLRLPQTLVLLCGGPLTLFLVSGSWLLALMASLALLAVLRFLAKYPWTEYVAMSLNTDMSDITKTYLSKQGSYFWVAECEEQVVGMVACLPAEDSTLERKQLELLHLSVALEHRGQGMAKALVRMVLQFARDLGYSEIILSTTAVQYSAIGLYQSLGFQKVHEYFFSTGFRITSVATIRFIYCLPSPQVCQAPQQGGGL